MTRKEAIKNLVTYAYFVDELPEEVAKSLDMAIDALKERPHGEWKADGTCSECGVYSSLNKETAYFCPNCGASMSANDRQVTGKLNSEKTCLNCGTSEQECELGNRARHGFCGNWTERR